MRTKGLRSTPWEKQLLRSPREDLRASSPGGEQEEIYERSQIELELKKIRRKEGKVDFVSSLSSFPGNYWWKTTRHSFLESSFQPQDVTKKVERSGATKARHDCWGRQKRERESEERERKNRTHSCRAVIEWQDDEFTVQQAFSSVCRRH